MVQKYIAALLVLTMLGLTSPCLAGDLASPKPLPQSRHLVNPKFIPQRATFSRVAGSLAFAPPESGQGQTGKSSTAASGQAGMTKGGKIVTGIGLAMVGTGAVMIAKGGQSAVGGDMAVDWRTTGYLWVSVGGVLTLIGLTRRHH